MSIELPRRAYPKSGYETPTPPQLTTSNYATPVTSPSHLTVEDVDVQAEISRKPAPGTCVLVPEDWRLADPVEIYRFVKGKERGFPSHEAARAWFSYSDHGTSLARAAAWFQRWPRAGVELDNFLGSGPFQSMDASHLCHHPFCIIHITYEGAAPWTVDEVVYACRDERAKRQKLESVAGPDVDSYALCDTIANLADRLSGPTFYRISLITSPHSNFHDQQQAPAEDAWHAAAYVRVQQDCFIFSSLFYPTPAAELEPRLSELVGYARVRDLLRLETTANNKDTVILNKYNKKRKGKDRRIARLWITGTPVGGEALAKTAPPPERLARRQTHHVEKHCGKYHNGASLQKGPIQLWELVRLVEC